MQWTRAGTQSSLSYQTVAVKLSIATLTSDRDPQRLKKQEVETE